MKYLRIEIGDRIRYITDDVFSDRGYITHEGYIFDVAAHHASVQVIGFGPTQVRRSQISEVLQTAAERDTA